jgi:glycosyltransferase involved in cell wall biosynthesis
MCCSRLHAMRGWGFRRWRRLPAGCPSWRPTSPRCAAWSNTSARGLLVPPDDPDALGNAALRLLNDRARAQQFAQHALQTAERFHIRHTVEQTAPLYRRLTRG